MSSGNEKIFEVLSGLAFCLSHCQNPNTLIKLLIEIHNRGIISKSELLNHFKKEASQASTYRWYRNLVEKHIIEEEDGLCSLNSVYEDILKTISGAPFSLDVFSPIAKPQVEDYFGVHPLNPSEWFSYLIAADIPSHICIKALGKVIKEIKNLNIERVREERVVQILHNALHEISPDYARKFYDRYNFSIRMYPYVEEDRRFSIEIHVEEYSKLIDRKDALSLSKEAQNIIRRTGFKLINPIFYRALLQNILLNRGSIHLVKNLMYHGIKDEEFKIYYDDPYRDLTLLKHIREKYVMNTLLNEKEIKAINNRDIYIHYLDLFGSRVTLFSLDCLRVVEKGLGYHRAPTNIEATISHLKQIFFSYPYIASDILFDDFNYVIAPFAFRENQSEQRLNQLVQGFLCEIDHATRIFTYPDNPYLKRMVNSVNLSTSTAITREAYLDGLKQSVTLTDEGIKGNAIRVLEIFLNQLAEGDAGQPFLYPSVYLKISSKDDELTALLSLVTEIILKWKGMCNFSVISKDSWVGKYSNVAYGDYMNCIHDLGTGICGLVSINIPRVALEHLHTETPIDEILWNKLEIATGILLKHYQKLRIAYDKLSKNMRLPHDFNFSEATNAIGVLGVKEYIKFLGEDPTSSSGLNEAKKLLECIRSVSHKLAERTGCGKIVISQTFLPRERFAESDQRKYGINNESYTSGCTMVTDESFLIEDPKRVVNSVNFEKSLYELTEGGGPAFQLKIFGEINKNNLQQLILDLVKNGTPVFKFNIRS